MYKLFLTFRYLTRKKIVIFPILVVWLCVMMLIIVTSIMGGFVDRVRETNRDIFGDIIISCDSSSQGFAGYDELNKEMKAKFPQIAGATPVVEAVAIVYFPFAQESRPAQLVGVKPEERSQVTSFRQSLFQQYKSPTQAAADLAKLLPGDKAVIISKAQAEKDTRETEYDEAISAYHRFDGMTAADVSRPAWGRAAWLVLVPLLGWLVYARGRRRRSAWAYVNTTFVSVAATGIVAAAVFWPTMFPATFELAEDRVHQAQMMRDQALRARDAAVALPAGDFKYQTKEDLVKAIVPAKPSFDLPADAPKDENLPAEGCIIGSQIGVFRRDSRGNFVHPYPWIYPKLTITVFPPSKSGKFNLSATNAVSQDFTMIDESHAGVFDVDKVNVYAPFESVQLMAGMRPDPKLVAMTPDADFDPRCHSIYIRVKPEALDNLKQTRKQIGDFVEEFEQRYMLTHPTAFPLTLQVQTWDEKQAHYLGAVENEKVMMTFIMLLMSGVVLVVIFLIFYQIVRDKTRDIGIIKAVGGSEAGVAVIFLSYGLMIGTVGGVLGVLSGWLFVTHTNEIHEFIYQTTGLIIWDRSVYIFDRIPDVVHMGDVITYFCVALVAGVVGALVPAIIAAFEDPVQAVRYE